METSYLFLDQLRVILIKPEPKIQSLFPFLPSLCSFIHPSIHLFTIGFLLSADNWPGAMLGPGDIQIKNTLTLSPYPHLSQKNLQYSEEKEL